MRRKVKNRSTIARSLWRLLSGGLIYLWLTFMALCALLPLMWMFSSSLRIPGESFELPPSFFPTSWRWDNWLAVLHSPLINYPLFFVNSVKLAVVITGFQLLLCSCAAFGFARLRFPGRDLLFFAFLATLMVPGQAVVVPRFIIIRNLKLIDSHWALILPSMASAYGVFLLRQFFLTLPGELMDAAKIDGAGFFDIYWRIMLPMIGPGLSALGVFVFLASWNDFFQPMLFLRSWDKLTLPVAIPILQTYMGEGSLAHVLAAITMSILPALGVYLSAQRFIIQGIALTGLKG